MNLDWLDHAACIGKGDLFFTDRAGPAAQHQVQAAQKICAACPVQIQCAEYAQHIGAGHGVWGGRHITSGTYRPVMFPPPHGTEARARWDLRHNIVPCVECHHAAAEAARSRRQAHTGGSQR